MNTFKSLILLTTSLLLISCSTTKESPGGIYFYDYDFSPYSEKGFLITPNEYRGEFESIGLITAEYHPKVSKDPILDEDGNVVQSELQYAENKTIFRIERINANDVIEQFYDRAVEMGADAISNFDITILTKTHDSLTVPYIQVTGFAIKRL